MMKKLLSTNQICCIIMLVTISNKLLILPALMYEHIGIDAIWVVFSKFLVAFAILAIFAILSKKYPNKTLEDLLVPYIGKLAYALILIAFGVFYLIKTYLTLIEGETFLHETIYVNLSSEFYIISTLLVAGYFVYKGVNTIGRTSEMLLKYIIYGIIITIALALPNVKLEQFLPVFTSSFSEFFNLFSEISIWFGNYFVVFLFLGKIKHSKNYIKKVLKSFLVSAVVVVLFFAVYYTVFGYSSQIHNFAINDIISLTPQLSSLIKIDWFTVIFYSFALILQVVVQVYLEFYVLSYIFKIKHNKLSISIFISALILIYILLPYSSEQVILFCSKTIAIYSQVINIVFPILIFIIMLLLNAKCNNKRVKRQIEDNSSKKYFKGVL